VEEAKKSGAEGRSVAESDTGLTASLVGGRYRLLEVAGSGAMATVHRARDEVLGRIVAVKTFREQTPDPQHQLRRHGEMEVLAHLNHPSLVQLYDVGTEASADGTSSVTYLVMEFVEGIDLRQTLRSGPLANDDVRRLGADLASALAYIHALGIVHRDIKPANVLVPDPSPRTGRRLPVKLTDFGIARFVDAARLTQTNTTIGTANYLSPEQARGEPVGAASDVYSLGLVLLECLTGRIEFPGQAVAAAAARLFRDPRVPQELGEPWVSLIPRMTAQNPAQRPTAADVAAILAETATEVLTPSAQAPTVPAPTLHGPSLRADDGGTRLLPAPPPRPPKAPPPRRRRFAPKTVAAVVALALIVLVVVLLAVLRPSSGGSSQQPSPSIPASPSIPGPLGTHIAQLERSVRP
jgi:serine/threonine protein kinase